VVQLTHCKRSIRESTLARATPVPDTHRNTHRIRTANGVCVKRALVQLFAQESEETEVPHKTGSWTYSYFRVRK